jgi:membrane-bound metal-dependent hydrolase YbcI (DUF457 family)
MQYNVEIRDIEETLTELVQRFPSSSEIALVHDAEEKLRVALHFWKEGHREFTTSLAVAACVDLYNLVQALCKA